MAVNPRFTAPDGSFSVSHPAPSAAYKITTNPNGVRADFLGGDGGTMQLMSRPANGRTAEVIAKALVKETFPDTKTAYEIPNAMVGYVPGYGMVADCWPQGANSNYMRMRVMVMGKVKNGLALIAGAVGPFRQFGPDFGIGKPSGANLQLALDMGKYVNSFSWRGDPAPLIHRRMVTLTNVIIRCCTQGVADNLPVRGSMRSRGAAAFSTVTLRQVSAVLPPERPWGLWASRQIIARVMDAFGPSLAGTRVEHVDVRTPDGRRVIGEWVYGAGVPRGGSAIYYVHGSGYALCSPRTHRRLTSWLSRLTGLPVFSVDYRLAPAHRFPTAADDVRASWD